MGKKVTAKEDSFTFAQRVAFVIRKIGIFIFICSTMLNGCNEKPVNNNGKLSDDQIIEIANQALRKAGVSLDVLKVKFDVDNQDWQKQLDYLRKFEPDLAHEYDILKKYSYQSVHYIPDEDKVLDMGEFFVFIDKQTGKVIKVPGQF